MVSVQTNKKNMNVEDFWYILNMCSQLHTVQVKLLIFLAIFITKLNI